MSEPSNSEQYGPIGPKASEDEIPATRRLGGGLKLRSVLPNAITAAALCSGLTGIRFAIVGDWEKAHNTDHRFRDRGVVKALAPHEGAVRHPVEPVHGDAGT